MITSCPDCGGNNLRTFSLFKDKDDRWEWWKGCNICNWEGRDEDEEVKHPEYYTRSELSPAKISKNKIKVKS